MNRQTLVAGDTLDFIVSVPQYPASDGWTLKYRLTPRFTAPVQAPIDLTATASGSDYSVQAAPAITASWVPGLYAWSRWVQKSGARQTLDESGELEVRQDPSTAAAGYDGRSQAAKAYDDLKAALAQFQSSGGRIKRYAIGSRQMEFETSAEIRKMMDFWSQELRGEEAAARLNKGQDASPAKIQVRF